MGSKSTSGTLVSPVIAAPSTGSVTVRIDEDVYGSVTSTSMGVKLLTSGGTELQSRTVTVTGGTYYVTFDGVESDYKIGIYPQERVYISGIGCYDGEFEAADFAAPARRAASATRTIEGITGTSHVVDGLTPGATYTYRVKAVCAEGASAWSNTIAVGLVTAIDHVGADADGAVEVYAADGRLLRRATREAWNRNLPAGTYIVRQGGTVTKQMLK